jgi:hypothetical protein
MESLCAAGEFVRALRVKFRFGELSVRRWAFFACR